MSARAFRLVIVALALSLLLTPVAAQSIDENDAWQFSDLAVTPNEYTVGQVVRASFTMRDAGDQPVSGLRASAILRAPSNANDWEPPIPILTTVGRELPDPGRYEVSIALNQAGRWWLEIRVEDENGDRARYDHFLIVESGAELPPATTERPLFLRGDDWDAYYRVDPATGSVSTIAGQDLLHVGDRWWVAETRLERRGVVSPDYGGTWRLRFHLTDAINGDTVTTIDAGEIRASVYPGSQREPAIATSLAAAPDGGAIYLYWARQLGEGWLSYVAIADPATGEIRHQRLLQGAITGTGFWAQIDLMTGGGQLVVAEQIVRFASVSGYRLSVLDSETLDTVVEYRRADARNDPLTHCMVTYPGPVGVLAGDLGYRYGLCSPPEASADLSLVVWNPMAGQAVHQIDLGEVARENASFVDGVASHDGRSFYAVNTRTLTVAEIDMLSGSIVREARLVPEPEDPSTWDRIFDWFFGSFTPTGAAAAGTFEPSLSIDPEGRYLYVLARAEGETGDGIWIIDLDTFEPVDRLMAGQTIDGIVATSNGQIAVIQRGANATGDEVIIIDHEGETHLTFYLPGRSDVIGSRR
jgi:hypothetical protein